MGWLARLFGRKAPQPEALKDIQQRRSGLPRQNAMPGKPAAKRPLPAGITAQIPQVDFLNPQDVGAATGPADSIVRPREGRPPFRLTSLLDRGTLDYSLCVSA
jgi:hypothetical protein